MIEVALETSVKFAMVKFAMSGAGRAGPAGIAKKTVKNRRKPSKNTRFRGLNTVFFPQNQAFFCRVFFKLPECVRPKTIAYGWDLFKAMSQGWTLRKNV